MSVKPVPDGYHSLTPYLSVNGAAQAIEFYRKAFGAKEVMRMPGPDGKIGHAEVTIEGSRVMLTDEYPAMNFVGPKARGGSTVHLHLYVADADRMTERALAAGATLLHAVETKFYGDRMGTVEDPFGHVWHLATHVEDVPMDELRRRAEKTTS